MLSLTVCPDFANFNSIVLASSVKFLPPTAKFDRGRDVHATKFINKCICLQFHLFASCDGMHNLPLGPSTSHDHFEFLIISYIARSIYTVS